MVDLSESATGSLRELMLSGPGIVTPSDTMELIRAGYAVRVVQLTPAGKEAAAYLPGIMNDMIVRSLENTFTTLEAVRDTLAERVAPAEGASHD